MAASKTKKRKKSAGSWIQERHLILGDKAEIYRVKQSGLNWQFRMWIPDEGKAVRKSLRTRDLDAAIQRAEEEVFKIHSDVQTGRKIFGITLLEAVDAYLAWRWEDTQVDPPIITKGRHSTIRSQAKHFLSYKNPAMKWSELDRSSFHDYRVWRMKTSGSQPVTIRNEEATINHLCDYAYRNGHSHFPRFDFRRFKISPDDIGRRSDFTFEEYDQLVRFLRSYVAKKNCPDEATRTERMMIRDCILILSNTCLRVGEAWQLTWKDILKTETIEQSESKPVKLIHLKVRGETSKTRKTRTVISRGGEYVDRLRANTKEPKNTHYIFGGAERFPKKKWYDHWKILMEGIGIENYQERKLTWYSLRHFGIKCRVMAGLSYEEIGLLAGTSPSHIMNHYYLPDDPEKKAAALKNFRIDKNGILIR